MSALTAMLAQHLVDLDEVISHAQRRGAWAEWLALCELRDATLVLRSRMMRLALPADVLARPLRVEEEVHPLA